MPLLVSPADCERHVDVPLGLSDWLTVTQDMVNDFAAVTRDRQFIHVDPELAAKTPFGGTIAHGFLSLSLLPYFANQESLAVTIEGAAMGLNYGLDKVRFLQPVRVGQRIRARASLSRIERKDENRFLLRQLYEVLIDGTDKPALVAEWLVMVVTQPAADD